MKIFFWDGIKMREVEARYTLLVVGFEVSRGKT
jgi:hypothetical protein